MPQMIFDVSLTSHELLMQGVCEAVFHRVVVDAETFSSGQCLAVQMVMATQAPRRSPLDFATEAVPVY